MGMVYVYAGEHWEFIHRFIFVPPRIDPKYSRFDNHCDRVSYNSILMAVLMEMCHLRAMLSDDFSLAFMTSYKLHANKPEAQISVTESEDLEVWAVNSICLPFI